MSVVIIGGNECMERRYIDLCRSYHCKAQVYTKQTASLKNVGSPDLLVLFTGTMSHKMLHCVMNSTKGQDLKIARCPTSSLSALRQVLDTHTRGAARV